MSSLLRDFMKKFIIRFTNQHKAAKRTLMLTQNDSNALMTSISFLMEMEIRLPSMNAEVF